MFVFDGDDGDDGILGIDGDVAATGIAPGDGTAGGAGGNGEGLTGYLLEQGDVLSGELAVTAEGGLGGNGGGGGLGGNAGAEAFNGGNGGNSGNGGDGGGLVITVTDVVADVLTIDLAAGLGGYGGGWDGIDLRGQGGTADGLGFTGGNGGHAGNGGKGGSVALTVDGATVADVIITMLAGNGGDGGAGSDGGAAPAAGGLGGNGGNAGDGGDGGDAVLIFTDADLLTSQGWAFAAGGGNGGFGQVGGLGGDGDAGDGGMGANGDGGNGGDATVTLSNSRFEITTTCGCEDAIEITALGGNGGFGFYSDEGSALDGVSGSGGNAVVQFTDNTLTAGADDEIISLSIGMSAGQGGVYGVGASYSTLGAKGANGTTTLDFAGNTIDGGDGTGDVFQLAIANVILDLWDTGVGLAPVGAINIDLTTGIFTIGGQINTITGIEHLDVLVQDGYIDSNGQFHSLAVGATLRGNSADNQFIGGLAGDALLGEDGDDDLDGDLGDDTLTGGLGNDTYYVDSAGDVIIENDGDGTADTVVSDITYSLAGTALEHLYLAEWYDTDGTGNASNNQITGSAGNNALDGGAGADSLYGGDGDDTFYVDDLGDSVYEDAGMGRDTVVSSVTFSLYGRFVERLTLTGAANIDATGNSLANILTGNDGNNVLDGGLNFDKMYGGLGDDTFYVDHAGDRIFEDAGGGSDVLYTSVGYDLTGRHIEVTYMTGSDNIDVYGNSLANEIHGNDGNNLLDGRAGADTLAGGLGDDTYVINTTFDVVTELSGEGTDTVLSSIAYVLGADVENLTLTGASDIRGTGNDLDNLLTGNAGANVLTGGFGNDTYYIQTIGDRVVEAKDQGNDIVYSTVGYSLFGTYVEVLILTGTKDVAATGNSQQNFLYGNDGANVLNGKGGADHLWGGLGADTFLFETASRVDTLYDFDAAEGDVIDISAYTAGTPYAGGVTILQNGGAALIQLGGGNSIWVENTTASDSDFLNAIIW